MSGTSDNQFVDFKLAITNLIKKSYGQICKDLVEIENNSDDSIGISSDLKKLFYLINKKQYGSTQLKDIHQSIYNRTWGRLEKEKGWNHVSWREAFILGQMSGICYYYTINDYKKTMELLDLSFIMGAPKDIILPMISIVHSQIIQSIESESQLQFPMLNNSIDRTHSSYPKLNDKQLIDVIELDKIDYQYFVDNYQSKSKPCIIRGDTSSWVAMDKWRDLNFFVKNYGWRLVPVEIGHNKLYGSNSEVENDSKEWFEKTMKLQEYIEKYMVGSIDKILLESQQVGYLAQHNLIEQFPDLVKDFKRPSLLPPGSDLSPHVWFGTSHTVTPLHYDSYHNFLTQLIGYKYVRLYPSNMKPYLYIENQDTQNSITSQSNMSLVDIESPDLTKFPLFSRTEQHYREFIMQPGDMLYIPSGEWHYVRSLSPSFSLSFWYDL
ncbi:transcription factor jumonji [Tieghemostelium lacteum]|uniref:Transcription factor jumonji n=1 Tax=Tieghemostelium lacteum TaxID=361077 RepID=A0A151ZIJ9_TIELA|nr:transcription factor jumonji [Tieghemostelium lacteum]|eukprot:KYQ93674.1 transcription factor jumonji [Tieghemostelium lacteum]